MRTETREALQEWLKQNPVRDSEGHVMRFYSPEIPVALVAALVEKALDE